MAAAFAVRNIPKWDAKGPSVFTRRSLSDREAAQLVDSKLVDDNKDLAKHVFERLWFTNIAFLLGYHLMRFRGSLTSIEVQPMPSWRRRYVANRMLPMVMRQTSKLVSAPVPWHVQPKSPDIADQLAAAMGTSLLVTKETEFGIPGARWEACLWSVLTGKGFLEVEWDPWANGSRRAYVDPLSSQEIDERKLTPNAKALLEEHGWFREMPNGDVRVKARSPFEVYVPHLLCGTSIESAPWLITREQMPMDEIWNRFDAKKVRQISPDRDQGISTYFIRRIKTLVAQFGYFSSIEERDPDEAATIRTMWQPPCARWPQGRKIVVSSNGVVLENVPHPYKDQRIRYPIAAMDYMPIPSRFWSKSLLEDLIQPQSEYNRDGTTLHEIRDLMGQPKWMCEKGSGINQITNRAGQMVWYNRGHPAPYPVVPQVDSAFHELLRQRHIDDLNTIAAQQDVSQAKAPSGVRSGVAIDLLQEQDDRAVAPAVKSQKQAIEKTGQMILRLAQIHYDQPRLIDMAGAERFQDTLYFKGQDLRDNDNVVLTEGALMPKSKAAETEKVFHSIEIGALDPTNPEEKEMILNTLEVGNSRELFAERLADRRRANIENDKFRQGEMPFPEVKPFDNPQIHLAVHNRFRKSDAYELLPPALQEAVDAHCRIHEEMQMQMVQAQMAMKGAGKGAPGEKGQASQPARKEQTPGPQPARSQG